MLFFSHISHISLMVQTNLATLFYILSCPLFALSITFFNVKGAALVQRTYWSIYFYVPVGFCEFRQATVKRGRHYCVASKSCWGTAIYWHHAHQDFWKVNLDQWSQLEDTAAVFKECSLWMCVCVGGLKATEPPLQMRHSTEDRIIMKSHPLPVWNKWLKHDQFWDT